MVKLNKWKKDKGRKGFTKGTSIKTSDDILSPEEIDRITTEEFNPVKEETEGQPEPQQQQEPQIKKTMSYDQARLEFLRIQIGPVKNFFQTLDNVLVSISERLGKIELKMLEIEVKDLLRNEYLRYSQEQNRLVSLEEFQAHCETIEKEKQSENKKL